MAGLASFGKDDLRVQYRTLGRTGLRVSLLGFGTGGARRMGEAQGHTTEQQNTLVRRCLDLGINLFDASEVYGDTEESLGEALAGVPRDSYVLATKWSYDKEDRSADDSGALRESAERSLRRLRTDYLDVLMFHGIMPDHYDEVVERYVPEMVRLRDEGVVRSIGFSERFPLDTSHRAATLALRRDPDLWDVIELKYGILNQLAAREVLPLTLEHNVGIINMASVRERLPDPTLLEQTIAEWKQTGYLAADSLPEEGPLDWLIHDDVDSVVSAGYKFAADHPTISTVLSGTASLTHLEANAAALEDPKLDDADKQRLIDLFGEVDEYA